VDQEDGDPSGGGRIGAYLGCGAGSEERQGQWEKRRAARAVRSGGLHRYSILRYTSDRDIGSESRCGLQREVFGRAVLVYCLQSPMAMINLVYDVFDGGRPDEGCGVLVTRLDVAVDRVFQGDDTGDGETLELTLGKLQEEGFHEVHSGGGR